MNSFGRFRLTFVSLERIDAKAVAINGLIDLIDFAQTISRTSLVLTQVHFVFASSSVKVLVANAVESGVDVLGKRIENGFIENVLASLKVQTRLLRTRSLVRLTVGSAEIGFTNAVELSLIVHVTNSSI